MEQYCISKYLLFYLFVEIELENIEVEDQSTNYDNMEIIDSIETGCIIKTIIASWDGTQISCFKHVQCGDSLKMNWIIVIVGPERPGCKQGHSQIEETSI